MLWSVYLQCGPPLAPRLSLALSTAQALAHLPVVLSCVGVGKAVLLSSPSFDVGAKYITWNREMYLWHLFS